MKRCPYCMDLIDDSSTMCARCGGTLSASANQGAGSRHGSDPEAPRWNSAESPIVVHCANGFTLSAAKGNLVISNGRTEETVPITRIQSFSLKEPGSFGSGSITFCTAQAANSGVNLGFGVHAAVGAEKNFFFSRSELKSAKALRDYVAGYSEPKPIAPTNGSVISVVDEIRGLKGLLDDGIITQEEFAAAKKKLLGI